MNNRTYLFFDLDIIFKLSLPLFIFVFFSKLLTQMINNKTMKMNEKGMITLPSYLRKKHNWNVGTEFIILEMDGHFEIIPILEPDQLPKLSAKDFAEIYDQARDQELELEK